MKKLLAIILSVAMLASCIPMTVFAEEEGGGEGDQPEEQEVKIVLTLVNKIVANEKFQKAFKDVNDFIDKYQKYIDNYQDFAKDFVNPEDDSVRKQYTDKLDNMIGDLDDLLVLLAQEENEDLEKLIEELRKIRENLVDLRTEIEGIIDDLSGDLEAIQTKIAGLLKTQYDIIKGYVDTVEKWVADELNELITDLRNAAWQVRKFTKEEIGKIIGRVKALEDIVDAKIAEVMPQVKDLIDKANHWAKLAVEKAAEQIRGDLEVLKAQIQKAQKVTEEQLKALVEKLRELDELIATEIAQTDEKVQALVDYIQGWIDSVATPALEELVAELKTKADELTELTEAEIQELIGYIIEKSDMLDAFIASKIAKMDERMEELIEKAKYWLAEVAAPALEELIKDLKIKAQDIKDFTEAEIQDLIEKAELLQELIATKIAEESEHLKELIAEAKEWLANVAEPVIKDIIADLKEKAQAVKEFTEEEIELILMRAEQLKEFIDMEFADGFRELKEQIFIARKWAEKAVAKAMDQIVTATKEIIKKAGHIAKEDIIKYFQMLREFKEIVKKYIEVIMEFDPREEIKELIDKAEELFEESIEWMREKALEYTMELIDNLQSGKYDWLLKPLGITGAELVDLLVDATAYAFGVMSGEGYLDLQDELTAALAQLDAALAALEDAEAELDPKNPNGKVHAMVQEISNLTNQLQQITTENTQLKNQIEELVKKDETEAEVIKKFINGYNVTKKKPTLKKVKAQKGRKVKVTFKSLAKVDCTQYRINYKTGKKAKTKKWNKKTSKSKTLNYTLKKLKKGKKYKIKVRAAYSFKYDGKTYTFLSKWSKTKKVKVK